MNIPPFIEFMCGRSSYSYDTSQPGTNTSSRGGIQKQEGIEDDMNRNNDINHYNSNIQMDSKVDYENEEEWALFDFVTNPPLCCKDSTMDSIFRLPTQDVMMGGEGHRATTLPLVSNGTSLFNTNDDEEEKEKEKGEDHSEKKNMAEETSKDHCSMNDIDSVTSSPKRWFPPLYRNMTLHSASSQADSHGDMIGHHSITDGPNVIPNDGSATTSSPQAVQGRRRLFSVDFEGGDRNDETKRIQDNGISIDFEPPRHDFIKSTIDPRVDNDFDEKDDGNGLPFSPGETIESLIADTNAFVASTQFQSSDGSILNMSSSFPGDLTSPVRINEHPLEYFNDLKPSWVICGRGQPTMTHPGNMKFKECMQEHEVEYLCARRSEKPKIAWALLDKFRAKGIKFVRREKLSTVHRMNENIDQTISDLATLKLDHKFPSSPPRSSSIDKEEDAQNEEWVWIDIGDRRAYAKITQALREEAPQLRRQLLSSTQTNRDSKEGKVQKQSTKTQSDPNSSKKVGKKKRSPRTALSEAVDQKKKKAKKDSKETRGEMRDEHNVAIVSQNYSSNRTPPSSTKMTTTTSTQTTTTTTTMAVGKCPQRTLFPSPSLTKTATSSMSSSPPSPMAVETTDYQHHYYDDHTHPHPHPNPHHHHSHYYQYGHFNHGLSPYGNDTGQGHHFYQYHPYGHHGYH